MHVVRQLKALGLDVFPCAVNYDYTKKKWAKHPVTVNRESWTVTAKRPLDDPTIQWSGTTVFGLPVPEGVVVIDLDTYLPGCTPQAVDTLLGVQIPWARAHIQTTISGGNHYAFKVPGWVVRQGSNIGGSFRGFDTRAAGRGFICSGEGYSPADSFGVTRLAYPESLPILPDACRALLEQPAADLIHKTELPNEDNREIDTLRKALVHIDPTERDTWRDVGFALKHYFHDDELTGFAIWDAWSRGEFWPEGCPPGYASETQQFQWSGFRAVREGATITIGTLFHMAIRGGWTPPARFDTSVAFGIGAASIETFSAIVDRIMAEGADSRKTEELLTAITTSGCNEVQALLLRNELKAIMKSAKILDKTLAAAIDKKTTPAVPATAAGMYAGNDSDNAALFLNQYYPNGSLIKCDGEFFFYNGRCWGQIHVDALRHKIALVMASVRPQVSRVKSCFEMVGTLCPVYRGGMQRAPHHKIIFNNGVLDVNTGILSAHSPDYLTTNLLPYDYNPRATCDGWLKFLNETLDADHERIALVQEWMGYLLTNDYRHHKVMFFLGPKRSGKGTIGRVIQQIVGEANFSGGSLTSFAADSFIDSLRSKPVLFIGDAEKRVAPSKVNQVIERIKTISGNDSVAFDRKFLSSLTETLPTRFTVAANSVPNLFDDSGALASRLLVIPFNRSFYGLEDLELANRLLSELPGIAAWALEGLRRLQYNGQFTVSAAGRIELQYISESYSLLARFIDEACVVSPEAECTSLGLHMAYRAWCLNEGEDVLKRRTFIGAMKDATRGEYVSYGTHRFQDDGIGKGFKGIRPAVPVAEGTVSAFQPRVVGRA